MGVHVRRHLPAQLRHDLLDAWLGASASGQPLPLHGVGSHDPGARLDAERGVPYGRQGALHQGRCKGCALHPHQAVARLRGLPSGAVAALVHGLASTVRRSIERHDSRPARRARLHRLVRG